MSSREKLYKINVQQRKGFNREFAARRHDVEIIISRLLKVGIEEHDTVSGRLFCGKNVNVYISNEQTIANALDVLVCVEKFNTDPNISILSPLIDNNYTKDYSGIKIPKEGETVTITGNRGAVQIPSVWIQKPDAPKKRVAPLKITGTVRLAADDPADIIEFCNVVIDRLKGEAPIDTTTAPEPYEHDYFDEDGGSVWGVVND